MPTALLDTSIYPSTVTHDATATRRVAQRGNRLVMWIEEAPVRRRLRGKTQEESDAIYRSLDQMAEMARDGALVPYDSDETIFESLYLHLPALRGSQFDVFRGVKRRIAQGPLRRTYMIEGCFSEEQARFSKEQHNRDREQFLENINHPRFLKMKKRTGGSHLADLYLVWTAEENSLDYFITLDTTFLNAVTLPKPLDTAVKLCTPMQFVQQCS